MKIKLFQRKKSQDYKEIESQEDLKKQATQPEQMQLGYTPVAQEEKQVEVKKKKGLGLNAGKKRGELPKELNEQKEMTPEQRQAEREAKNQEEAQEYEEKEREHEEKIIRALRESFLAQYIEEGSNVTDVKFDGTTLRIKDNEKGLYKPENQPTAYEVEKVLKRISNVMGKEFTTTEPILDTEVAGFRINGQHRAISPSGATIALRISRPYLAIQDTSVLAPKDVVQMVSKLMYANQNLLISGITGSGKTELQKVLVGFFNPTTEIYLAEDTMDSHIKELYPDLSIISVRTLTGENRKNKIGFDKLNQSALRNNPDRLMIAEIRDGITANNFVESALTGHSVLATIHSAGAKVSPSRLRNMISSVLPIEPNLLAQDIVECIPYGLHMELTQFTLPIKRRFREVVEYVGFDENGVKSNVLYEVQEEYVESEDRYITTYQISPLSAKSVQRLKNARCYHEVPDIFKPEKWDKHDVHGNPIPKIYRESDDKMEAK